MKNTMEYKGYLGTVEFSEEDCVFFGKVIGIRGLISYEGTSAKQLVENFHQAVEDYLELCEKQNVKPEKVYKGSFNIRISPELHKQIAVCAISKQISLNRLVEDALRTYMISRV